MLFTGVAFADSGDEWELAEIRPIGDINAEAPEITAKGAAMYSLDLDDFVYAKNADKKLDPYSITKILTCYLAIENLDLDKVVTASAASARVYENGTTIFLKEGEKMTVRDLIYGTLLESGNDAAYALGEAVAGSEADFADLMNRTAADWGCTDTHFVNANGWKHKKHYTTAHDMTIIAKNCFANEPLAKISATKKYTIPATNLTEARELKNYFLATAARTKEVTCGKTGTWDEDDCSIVAGFSKDGVDEIIVLLRDTKKGRAADLGKLVEFSTAVTPGFLVSDEGEFVDIARVRHGEFTKVPLAVSGRTVAYPSSRSADDISIDIDADELEAPLTKGDKAGTYTVYCEGEKVGSYDLIVTEDIETGWLPSYLYISNEQTIFIGECAGAVLAVILVIILIVKASKRRKNKAPAGKHDIRK